MLNAASRLGTGQADARLRVSRARGKYVGMIFRLMLFIALALTSTLATAQGISVPELGREFRNVQAAVDAIGEGRGTVLLAPGRYRQCAVQEAGSVTFRSAEPGQAIFDGATCEGKAALVLRGNGATVDGIVFQNMRVPDLNGAGIRLERGDLDIVNAMFRNSEQGILTADDPSSAIRIDRSTFSGLGRCGDHPCAHSIYIGNYGSLTVTRSRFERGTGGHYVKSRAARAEIVDNMFDDSQGRETNYMIDLPAGATGRIAGNYFVQGENKENYSALIAVAAEDRLHPSAGLAITGNRARIVEGVARNTVFVADWSGERLAQSGNQLGEGIGSYERR
jgi:hypothetical protein